jgi:hypothetical protein
MNNGVNVQNGNTADIDATESGDYTVLVSYLGCSLISTPVTVSVTPVSDPPLVHDYSVCNQGTASLNATSNETVNWYSVPTGSAPLFTGNNYVTPLLTQTVTYYAEAGLVCPSQRIPVNVNILQSPVPFIGNDTIVVTGSTVTLDAGSGYASYEWSDGSTSQVIQVQSPATAWVSVTDSAGCSGSDTINISTPTIASEIDGPGYSVYPNPVIDKLNYDVDLGQDEHMLVQLIDASGRTVNQTTIHGHGFVHGVMDVDNIAKGIYVLSFISDHESMKVLLKIKS